MTKYLTFFVCFFQLITLSGRDTTLFKIITSPTPIRHMTNIDGKIILARYDGIFEFDGENFKESNYEYKDLAVSLEKNEQWAKLADPKMDFAQVQLSSDGIYWVLIRNKFLYGFRIIEKIKRMLPEYSIRGIYVSGDSVYIATYNGFYLGNKQIYKDTLLFSNSNFWIDKEYIYFSANYEDHVYRVDKEFSNLKIILPGELKDKFIKNISSVSIFNGDLYVGGQSGFGRFNEKSGFELIDKNVVVSNIHIIKGKLWLACVDGIYVLDGEKLVRKFNESSTGLFPVGDKLFSTGFEGLWEYNMNANKQTNIFKGTVYEDIETDALYADLFGNYWISTIDGMLKYNINDKKISSILEGTEFNRRSYFFKGDTLYFGSNSNGLIRFEVENMISDDVMNSIDGKKGKFGYFLLVLFLISFLITFFIWFKRKQMPVYIKDTSKQNKKSDTNKIFSELEIYIRNNIDDLNVDQIRYQTGLTKYAFYTKFQEYFGKKPKELIAEIKEKILSENQRVTK
jgi:ligand-binding sensor domain-containing protein